MDDITPLQQLDTKVIKKEVHLFQPRNAYRFHRKTGSPSGNASAFINYYLKEPVKNGVKIRIKDSEGTVIDNLRGSNNKGINRSTWGMRYPGADPLKLRIKPAGNPTVVEEKRYRDSWMKEGWYPFQSWGTTGGLYGYMVAPGKYLVELEANGKVMSQELVILKDPSSDGDQAQIELNLDLQHKLQKDINLITEMINRIEWSRKQLADLAMLPQANKNNTIGQAISDLDQKFAQIEDQLLQPISREGDSKSFRYPNLLYSKLSVLAGDVGKNFDFAPNKQQIEVYDLLHNQLIMKQQELDQMIKTELPKFNTILQQEHLAGISY